MNTDKALGMALHHMEKHGLDDWSFEWTRAVREYGRCNYSRKVIYLSKVLSAVVDELHVLDTILHEIAHALVGPGHHHNDIWKAKAKELGCTPNATCARSYDDKQLPPKWVMVFEGEIISRWFRKPRQTTFAKLPYTWAKGRKDETYGKMEIISYEQFNKNIVADIVTCTN